MLDLFIVLLFVAVSVGGGLRSRRSASRNLREFFLAGKTLSGWQAGTSMAATQFAADTPLVVMGLVATAGIYALWQLWVYGLAFLSLAFLFAPHWQRASVLTDAELTEIRYSGRGVLAVRTVKALYFGTVINCIVLAMVLKATVSITEVFLPWHQWIAHPWYELLRALVETTGVTVASGLTALDPVVASTNNLLSVVVILAFVALYSTTGGSGEWCSPTWSSSPWRCAGPWPSPRSSSPRQEVSRDSRTGCSSSTRRRRRERCWPSLHAPAPSSLLFSSS